MPEQLRIVFMGTPDFAVESLKRLVESGKHVAGVVTAPDKPAGRGKYIQIPPVKQYALSAGIQNILQPPNLKSPVFIEELKSLGADLQLVVAFRMLPEVVWEMPLKGTVNLHASLLPDYRGAAPINWAIINGEKETGVTTFFIEKEIDTGKIIFSEKVAIGSDTTAGELHDVLMVKGADLLIKTAEAIAAGNYPVISQSEYGKNAVIHNAPKIYKEDCRINWTEKGKKIHDFIRGLSPYPAAWTEITDGEKVLPLKIYRAQFIPKDYSGEPGILQAKHENRLTVTVKDGVIQIRQLQLAGKKKLDASDFLRGFKDIENYSVK
jgi:methionyl-tRNA formyltransferase